MASCWSTKDPSSFSCAPSGQEKDKSSFRAHPAALKEPLAPSSWNARQAMNCTSAQRGGTKAAPSFPGTGGILDQTSLRHSRLMGDFLSIWMWSNSWKLWSREMTLSRSLMRRPKSMSNCLTKKPKATPFWTLSNQPLLKQRPISRQVKGFKAKFPHSRRNKKLILSLLHWGKHLKSSLKQYTL